MTGEDKKRFEAAVSGLFDQVAAELKKGGRSMSGQFVGDGTFKADADFGRPEVSPHHMMWLTIQAPKRTIGGFSAAPKFTGTLSVTIHSMFGRSRTWSRSVVPEKIATELLKHFDKCDQHDKHVEETKKASAQKKATRERYKSILQKFPGLPDSTSMTITDDGIEFKTLLVSEEDVRRAVAMAQEKDR